ncbi:MAG: peptide ABC transporter permease [Chromatiales bacterium]|nr:peptide ABC transporter permease [Chromatiales bacterium]
MISADLIRFTLSSARAHRLRSGLTALGIGIGVTAVVLLTSIGEGLQQYLLREFTQFGTNIISVSPGKASTFGGSMAASFNSTRPLSLGDAEALSRVPFVTHSVGTVQGNAEVEGNGRSRRTMVSGTGPYMPRVWLFAVALGEFLPADEESAPRPFVVLGSKVRDELFGTANPLGERIRVGGSRFRVIGVMESKGTVLGFDMDDAVYIPVLRAFELFNKDGLVDISVLYEESASAEEVVAGIRRMMITRHGGEDFTITTQQQMLDVLGSVLNIVTIAVAGLGGISLLVGGVGIFTIMTIAVRERTSEIGLLRSLGAVRRDVRDIFLGESIMLAALGGVGGVIFGGLIVETTKILVPALPLSYSIPFAIAAETVAILIGLLAGVLPARKAANLDPVDALRTE